MFQNQHLTETFKNTYWKTLHIFLMKITIRTINAINLLENQFLVY